MLAIKTPAAAIAKAFISVDLFLFGVVFQRPEADPVPSRFDILIGKTCSKIL